MFEVVMSPTTTAMCMLSALYKGWKHLVRQGLRIWKRESFFKLCSLYFIGIYLSSKV